MLKQVLKDHMTAGLYSALRTVVAEFKISRIHLKGVRKAKALRNRDNLKLNFGCGPNIKSGYINIDLCEGAGCASTSGSRCPSRIIHARWCIPSTSSSTLRIRTMRCAS